MKSRVRKVDNDVAPRVEGEAFYALQAFQLSSDVAVQFRCFEQLPLTDAVGLLSGDDQTGLIVWEGTLRLLQYLYETQFLTDLASSSFRSIFVELGCGCGALSTGVVQLLSIRDGDSHAVVLVTDGNDDCVELARGNVMSVALGNDTCVKERVALPYLWDTALPDALVAHLTLADQRVVVLSGDVIYSQEAIQPLVSSVRRMAAATAGTQSTFTWLLSYIPRSLTKAANDRIFDELKDALGTLVTTESNTAMSFFGFPDASSSSGDRDNTWWTARDDSMRDEFRLNGFLAVIQVPCGQA